MFYSRIDIQEHIGNDSHEKNAKNLKERNRLGCGAIQSPIKKWKGNWQIKLFACMSPVHLIRCCAGGKTFYLNVFCHGEKILYALRLKKRFKVSIGPFFHAIWQNEKSLISLFIFSFISFLEYHHENKTKNPNP